MPPSFDPIRIELGNLRFDGLSIGGQDRPLALFLHGFPQFADAWAPIMEEIAGKGFWCVAIDQRGYSPSARPDAEAAYASEKLIGDLFGFADALGRDSFHLLAHDWGGILAWRAAAQQPGRLLSLTIVSIPHPDALFEAIAHDPDQARRSEYVTFFRLPNHAAEAAMLADGAARLRGAYLGKVDPVVVERNVARLSEPGALTAALNWYRQLDFEDRIGSIRVPTLFIWGDQDHALGPHAAAATAALVEARFDFHPLPGLSHWLLDEAPGQVAAAAIEHLARSS